MPDSTDSIVSPEALISTILSALENARIRGGPWKSVAEEHLGGVEELLERAKQLTSETQGRLAETTAQVDTLEKKMLYLLETITEDLWDRRGRQHQDALISILTPGTPSFFFDSPIGHGADRFQAVLQFLGAYVSGSARAGAGMEEIQALLPKFQAACESARALQARLEVFEKMTESFARLGHVQYTRTRRRMRVEGFHSLEIRAVFPDIPGNEGTSTLAQNEEGR